MRPWLDRLHTLGGLSLDALNRLAGEAELRTESGRPVQFASPSSDRYYEMRTYESGIIESRPDSAHDLFNALAWLAFPKTKARINAMHAARIPAEGGRRGRFRDLLTVFDEGGVIVRCDDAELVSLAREHRWKSLFWQHRRRVLRSMKPVVLGHAVLEKALDPWPGIACKALFVPFDADPDQAAASWLASLPASATPRLMPAVPVFGYPGWDPRSMEAAYYDDERYFRPHPRGLKWRSGVGQAAAAYCAEESPGSAERDAG